MFTKWWTGGSKFPDRILRAALAAGLAAAVAAVSGCSLLPKEPEEEVLPIITPPKLSEKPTYEVVTATLEAKVQGTGKVMSLKEENLFFTENGGRLKGVYVETGQQVEAGQLIAELDVSDKERELRRARLEFRREELAMIEVLRKQDEYEPDELEQLKIDFELKRTALVELEEAIAGAKLYAPFSGTIVSVKAKAGDMVEAYSPIAVISDLSKLAIAAKLSRDNLSKVAVGMDAIVSLGTAGTHRGKVSRLPEEQSSGGNNQEDSIENYMLVELEEWPEGAVRGMPLNVTVITNRIENAIVIPPAALRTYSGRNYVQVVDEEGNKAEVDVEVGMQTPTQVQIVKGLKPGQKVVGR